jgi:uncharacterized membrane protein YgdD (TMEM256/DUF423 family)
VLNSIKSRKLMAWCFLLSGIAVIFGALGSHLFSQILSETKLEIFNKASFYLLIHSISVVVLLLVNNTPNFRINPLGIYTLFWGTLLFCLSLYLVSISDFPQIKFLKKASILAPFGGVLMISGWLISSFSLFSNKTKK